MANHYTHSSSIIRIPEGQREQAEAILARIEKEIEASPDEYCGFRATVEDDGMWIRDDDESITPTHVALLVEALVEELDLPGIHVVSWAYTCSKPRYGEFGGGAFAAQKGQETAWIDAAHAAEDAAKTKP